MLVNKICPNCKTEQKGLDLIETDGSYICSKCGEEVKVNLEERNKQTNKKATE